MPATGNNPSVHGARCHMHGHSAMPILEGAATWMSQWFEDGMLRCAVRMLEEANRAGDLEGMVRALAGGMQDCVKARLSMKLTSRCARWCSGDACMLLACRFRVHVVFTRMLIKWLITQYS